MDLAKPLSASELDEVEEMILEIAEAAGHPDDDRLYNVDSLDGFLTCVVIGPEAIMPSEWLPAMFGGELPEWRSQAQFERLFGLTVRHMNAIAMRAASQPPRFEPHFAIDKVGRTKHVIVES